MSITLLINNYVEEWEVGLIAASQNFAPPQAAVGGGGS